MASDSAQPPAGPPGAEPSRRGFAMAIMLLSSMAISFGGLVIREIEVADVWHINFYRSLAFMVAILLIMALRYRRDTLGKILGIGRAGLFGALLLTVAGIAFLQSLTHTTVANTLFVLSAIPFFAAALARLFLGERIGRATLVTMIAAAAGLTVMVAEGFALGSVYGNAMALVTAFCFASYAVILRYKQGTEMMATLLLSGLLVCAIGFLMRGGDLGLPLRDILLCFLWGGVLSGFANATFVIAARYLAAGEVTIFMLLEFALGPVWVWLFIDEVPTDLTIAGGALVILAVAIRAAFELRRGRRL